MTQEEKRICAERLFDAIGDMDDRFILEAESPYVRRSGVIWFRALLIGAASIALALSVTVGVFVVGMMGKGQGEAENDADNLQDNMQESMEESVGGATLSARLSSVRAQTADDVTKESDIDLFDGTPKVIWKYSDEELFRTKAISDDEYQRLTGLITKNKGERVDDPSDNSLEGVWIASGDGLVISPCLEQTAGNVGYGEIFDYVPEYEPSAELTDSLCDCIS